MTVDPSALLRTMLAEWEKMANEVGGRYLRSDEWSRTMHGAQGGVLQAQEAFRATMERTLAAAHMPSREEVTDLADRLGRIEAQLARIEAALAPAPDPAAPSRPRPARTRKPPEKT